MGKMSQGEFNFKIKFWKWPQLLNFKPESLVLPMAKWP